MFRTPTAGAIGLAIFASACSSPSNAPVFEVLSLRTDRDTVRVVADEEPFATVIAAAGEPFAISELRAAGGHHVLRGFPRAPRAGESRDHPEHRGLFVGHADVEGTDTWHAPQHVEVVSQSIGFEEDWKATLDLRLLWRDGDGFVLCDERRRVDFLSRDGLRFVDVEHELRSPAGGVTFGDVKEAFLALRLANEFARAGSDGLRFADDATGTGQAARWVAWRAPFTGSDDDTASTVTVAVLDHPLNHGHPTRWQVRDYGLVAANPFGVDAFASADSPPPDPLNPRGPRGTLRIEPYGSLTLRYRVVVAPIELDDSFVDELWDEFARE